ncbi:DUF2637 domain-containing protein [Actinoplanes sp. N902-109]|uniref:DUF2637 domain-containing protein n=1 Tax=Actinoplanes sp. (strain N902-109) TaxID=649831 RepID=UPI0003295812|nr:DUF2637 domain-containing protein [Actinoplanes sp. N902-109]AGL13900.1 hypothetical protein L083_0390 [Actinoplanes sp. N902-109]
MQEQKLIVLRRIVRGVLALALAVSLVANVLHAQDNVISQAISAWPPLALMLTVELISRIPVSSFWLATARIMATTAIAGIAAWVSYWHMVAVAKHYGEANYGSEYLWPLTVDGLAIVASIGLVEISGRLASRAAGHKPASEAASSTPSWPVPEWLASDDHEVDTADPWDTYSKPVAPTVSEPVSLAEQVGQEAADEVGQILGHNLDAEVATWAASTDGHREVELAKAKVATPVARRTTASYDQDAARAVIREQLDLDFPASAIDERVANQFGVSARTARRLRGQVANEPVSGPPSDVQDGDR